MFKRGLDQVTVWVIAIFLGGAIYGGLYGGMRWLGNRTAAQRDLAWQHQDSTATSSAAHGADAAANVPEAPATHGEPAAAGQQAEVDGHDAGGGSPTGLAASAGSHGDGPHWSYRGSAGPQNWGQLAASYQACSTGKTQSPVDIDTAVTNDKLLPIRFRYRETDGLVINNGHTVQVDFQPGSFVEIDGDRYNLMQMHFHAPSEHKITGIPYDMELHLVHKSAEGKLAVIGILFEQGADHKPLVPVFSVMPRTPEDTAEPVVLDPSDLLPQKRVYYHYIGSLTTPPCSEGVRWYVMVQPVEIGARQVDAFISVSSTNARPVQPLKGRQVQRSTR